MQPSVNQVNNAGQRQGHNWKRKRDKHLKGKCGEKEEVKLRKL
ncbi:hypothetical protein PC129_g14719 [Phytophthora cactorum]|uniref:Uncharacterized protein n=1 Tax=Phytophthora cactorum TaxID=29920 RepID=A0A329RS80_9STRA|nr:hypothetical protein PC113_g15922 [Phytophthora cactorum]KAG3005510.1 hypothetical protein PC120_g17931 [Phytophthora cactorum]KAG3147307.1 hypothetical protein C6341_g17791 [Phytophthora cactorum]KAG3169937.1 hypothetical protein PC128_g19043 [Phytophthora cactorum]KAG3214380.1 hypothetical protein PC129_g14719 [Phytophthora cactorum]